MRTTPPDTAAAGTTTGRGHITQATLGMAMLYTGPVLDLAADLLADLHDAGQRHGVGPGVWATLGTDLPRACIRAAARRIGDHNLAHAMVSSQLLDQVAEQLAARSIGHYRRPGHVVIRRTGHMPPAGYRGRQDLAVAVTLTGWSIGAHPAQGHPIVPVIATHDPAGADAVADLVADICDGHLAYNPFRQEL